MIKNERVTLNTPLTLYKMSKVNLDALIPRADFIESTPSTTHGLSGEITLPHLVKSGIGSIYNTLRKPDFQRETNEWDKSKIFDLIDSFMEGNFVPSIILWKSPASFIFVIDGAHRLSALIAYINDDYGDEEISQQYFNYNIPDEEKTLAFECREFINKGIKSFSDIRKIFDNPSSYPEKEVIRARNFMQFTLKVQEIKHANAKDAERSFFKINQQGVALSTTEKKLCFSRDKPNCIATRAIMKGGYGHQYWKNFTDDNQGKVKEIAQQVNTLLFKPPLEKLPKTHEHFPMGGKITSGMPMVYDFLSSFNKKDGKQIKLANDLNGNDTVKFLWEARKSAWLLNSSHPSSLGLHPLVYFYTSTGAHQQTAFLAINEVILQLDREKKLPIFTSVRAEFEDFLIKFKIFIAQLIRKFGSKNKAEKHLRDFYISLIDLFFQLNSSAINILAKLKTEDEEKILKELTTKFDTLNPSESEFEKTNRKRVSTEVSLGVVIKEDLANCKRCQICNARLNHKSISKEHIIKQEFKEGAGSIVNIVLSHPYCNSGYNNWKEHESKKSDNSQ